MMNITKMHFHPLGDQALVISFEEKISLEIHAQVVRLTHYLKSKKVEGILYYIPAYCSLTLGYDPGKWNFSDLSERILRFREKLENQPYEKTPGRSWQIPVCYDSPFGPDLESLAREKEVSRDQIIAWHSSKTYTVYMLGFLPGFVYLGELPEQLLCKRKKQPRTKVPARSVAIAGSQTGIYPLDAPGGWQIIGKTPVPVFFPRSETPFLFESGDQVRFVSVSKPRFEKLESMEYEELKLQCLRNDLFADL